MRALTRYSRVRRSREYQTPQTRQRLEARERQLAEVRRHPRAHAEPVPRRGEQTMSPKRVVRSPRRLPPNVSRLPNPTRTLKLLAIPFAIPLLVGAYALGQRIASAEPPSQAELLAMGTRSEDMTFERLPREHPVDIPKVRGGAGEALGAYVRAIGRGRLIEHAAYFDPNTGRIRVVSAELRLEATLPDPLRPTLRHAVRHEYGHAFLLDLVAERDGGRSSAPVIADRASRLSAVTPDARALPTDYPPEVGPVLGDYMESPIGLYGGEYFTESFGEYFAESYSRVLNGQEVPAETKAFFRRYASTGQSR